MSRRSKKSYTLYVVPSGLILFGAVLIFLGTLKPEPRENRFETHESEGTAFQASSSGVDSVVTQGERREPAQATQSGINQVQKNKPGQQWTKAENQIKDLKDCYQVEDCDFPQTDPKSYHFAVGQALTEVLKILEAKIIKQGLRDPKLVDAALDALKVDDGHVKEIALHVLSSQDISEKSVDVLINDVLNYHDPSLIQHAMLELSRYMGTGSEEKIHRAIAQVLKTGSPQVSHEVAKYIHIFVNVESLTLYRGVLNQLVLGSKIYRTLKVKIEEFQRTQSAA